MTDPLATLRELLDGEPMEDAPDWNAACADWVHENGAACEQLVQAARAVHALAASSFDGDSWYAEHDGLDGEAILAQSRAALARFDGNTT